MFIKFLFYFLDVDDLLKNVILIGIKSKDDLKLYFKDYPNIAFRTF